MQKHKTHLLKRTKTTQNDGEFINHYQGFLGKKGEAKPTIFKYPLEEAI